MPELDHISANKRLKSQGSIKRMMDLLPSFGFGNKNPDTQFNNIFAPTAALSLFKKFE